MYLPFCPLIMKQYLAGPGYLRSLVWKDLLFAQLLSLELRAPAQEISALLYGKLEAPEV